MSGDPEGRKLKTLENSLEIVEFVKESGGVRMDDVIEQFDMAKSTAYGYLFTLEKSGLLVKHGPEYVLGLQLLHLGECAKSRNKYYPLARKYVFQIADELGEGADFTVQEQGKLFTIYNDVESIEDPNFQVGRRFDLHNSAGGKAVLAELPRYRVNEIIDRWGLPASTSSTITDRETLLNEINKVREQGFGITDEELVKGMRSVGVAITYPDGSVFGALGVGGPAYRINDDRLFEQIPNKLLDKKQALEADLRQAHESGTLN
ncbi:IclR family transcriptional regulator [Natronomonas salsuginis]|uniref:IclR family transcriptional regulator n=1 Tax=Natronomonas salsuginis TaxID=2217661 RepID=A0A4V5ZNU2_9EURY|nr:IclR family transcriptional regulator [Natronomonas salsuginis]TKR25183.1 IclR family transcriptional regulator [Natronomonas salsuginis]